MCSEYFTSSLVRRMALLTGAVLLAASAEGTALADQRSSLPELDTPQLGGKPSPSPRNGVVLGGSLGFALGSAAGYPNDVRLDGNPAYYGSTPAMPGYSFNLFFMGALTPYLNVGFWGGAASFANSEWRSRGGGGGLRVEGFPLMAVCGCVIPASFASALGLYGMAGIGSTSTDVKRSGNYETIGGVQSYLAAGAFYELKLGRVLTLGPDLRYEVIASRTSDRNAMVAGLRIAFYPAN
jgi:hypothetical protein